MRAVGMLLVLGACRFGFDAVSGASVDAMEDLSGSSTQLRLTFDNTGREALIDMPVLVTLTPARIDYAKLQADGRDLRFVDSDGAPLPYELDVWDPAGTSRIWVRVPKIDAGSSANYVFAVYGNPDLVDGQNAAAVWSDYAAVWHFREAPAAGARALDSSPNRNDGVFHATMTAANRIAGSIGTAISFDGNDDFIQVADSASLDLQTLTIEGWVRVSAYPAAGAKYMLVAKEGVGADTTGAYNAFMNEVGRVSYETNNLTPTGFAFACCVALDTWAAFAMTIDQAATSHSFINGTPGTTQNDVTPMSLSTSLTIGRRGLADAFLPGAVDEIRLSSRVRSADWISANYASMTDALITYGQPEPR
jgi:hypothetical protein